MSWERSLNYHFKISIENKEGGRITLTNLLSHEGRDEPIEVGRVLRRATSVRSESFRASEHGEPSTVIASAVNAIHLKVHSQATMGKGATISIYPKELYGKSLQGNPEPFRPYAIYTDIPAGASLFGGGFSPIPGSPVTVIRNGKRSKLEFGYVPSLGDIFEIEVTEPEEPLKRIVFQNVENGRVIVEWVRGTKQVVAKVVKPVRGVGRFEGSVLSPQNSIRAVHSAVIDISTSPKGRVGGFQIVPSQHVVSKEMVKAVVLPQYMLVSWNQPLLGGAPLFSGYLFPRVASEQTSVDTPYEKALSEIPHLPRVKILGDFGQGFRPLPTLEGRNENALSSLKTLVIEFVYE